MVLMRSVNSIVDFLHALEWLEAKNLNNFKHLHCAQGVLTHSIPARTEFPDLLHALNEYRHRRGPSGARISNDFKGLYRCFMECLRCLS